MQEVVLFYNGLDVPTRQILDSRGAVPSKTTSDAKVAIQEMAEYSQKWHNGTSRTRSTKTSNGLAAIQAQLNILDEKSRKKEKDPGSFTLTCLINNVYFDNALANLGASISVIPLSTYLNLGLGELPYTKLTVELADKTVKYPKGIVENVLVGIEFGEEKIIFKSVKPASSFIKRVYMLSLRERMELDLEARLMGETLVLNRSLDPFFGDYIEVNDLNVPLELRRDQVDDLIPTIEEGDVIEEFRARNDARMVSKVFGYPSDCDHDKKIRIDCAYNLKFSCMIDFDFLHANFFSILYVNVISKKFYNSIRKDKLEYKGSNVVGALMNIPIFVETFSILIDFAVLEDMDAYRGEGMGDVIFGEPFLREVN
ncbi:putative reverse transcriptase domain-containing protein [Tanacetum coccineum]